MAAFASTTDRIKIGSGVVDCWTRNPARLASTFSTLDDLAPGRIILGLGAWWDPLAAKVGIERSRPLRVMREVVEACRALLACDGPVTYDGYFVHLDGVELDYVHQQRRAKEVPIYIGATGMKMMELAGRIADGVVLNYMVEPAYNDRAMAALEAGATAAGRDLDDRRLRRLDPVTLAVPIRRLSGAETSCSPRARSVSTAVCSSRTGSRRRPPRCSSTCVQCRHRRMHRLPMW